MRIHVINPNTSNSMTEKIAVAAKNASRTAEVVALTNSEGPASLESHFDEALAVPGLLRTIREIRDGETDGILLACFGDPGVHAARELSSVPVFGIAEAAMRTAAALSSKFSIVTTLARTIPIAENILQQIGLERSCARIRACEIPVSDLEDKGGDPKAFKTLLEECKRAVDEDGVDALVLGCAGMADLTANISTELGIPVVDGVAAGVQLLESLANLGLRPAKIGDRAKPPAKNIIGPNADLGRA